MSGTSRKSSFKLIHLGDTSIRRQEVIKSYRQLLAVLSRYRDDGQWSSDKKSGDDGHVLQSNIYQHIVANVESFKSKEGAVLSLETQAQRARTYTNAIVKAGLCDDQRRLTTLGELLLDNSNFNNDEFEASANLKPDNSIMLRGISGYKSTNADSNKVSPFLDLVYAIGHYGSLSVDEFQWAFMLSPTLSGDRKENIDRGLSRIREGGESFRDLLHEIAVSGIDKSSLAQFIETGEETEGVFYNNKGQLYIERYWRFYYSLESFRENPSVGTLSQLRRDAGNTSVKTAFLTSENVPGANRKLGKDPEYVYDNIEYPCFREGTVEDFRKAMVEFFYLGKSLALMGEYLDNNLRLLLTTGLFENRSNIIAPAGAFFKEYVKILADALSTSVDWEAYGDKLRFGMVETFGESILDDSFKSLSNVYGINIDEIDEYLYAQRRKEFDEFLNEYLPVSKVARILNKIAVGYGNPDEEKAIRAEFSDVATVPTLFEYLIGISAYYMAGRSYDVEESFGLPLDGNHMPMRCAEGNRGDIEISTPSYRLLIEVTLMDRSNQRRNELEPVLRHAVNFSAESTGLDDVATLFITNDVDFNVARILGFGRLMKLRPTKSKNKSLQSPVIASLKTSLWASLLDRKIGLSHIVESILKDQDIDAEELNGGWLDDFANTLTT